MILGFKTKFPDGSPTLFPQKILSLNDVPKIHTIREGQRWKAGMKIHFATGVRTKNYSCFRVDTVSSVQRIDIIHRNKNCKIIFIDRKLFYSLIKDEPFFSGTEYNGLAFLEFIKNDGFDNEFQFWNWFKKPLRNGQLIHFTDFKY